MSDPARYFIAKYISDLHRMEPRNIGVVVCARNCISARFLAEDPERPGDVDGRSVPPFVASTGVYKQWVEFWRSEITKHGTYSHSQTLMERLKQANRGNFMLTDGGVVLEVVHDDQLRYLTNDLFHRLVQTNGADEIRDPKLDQIVDRLIRDLRLNQNQNFRNRYEISCRIGRDVMERFEFSHAYKNGILKRLYQRVPLARRRAPLRRTVHDTAWMFEKVVGQRIIKPEQAIALVYATDDLTRDPEVGWSLDVLQSVSKVVNLADQKQAASAFVVD